VLIAFLYILAICCALGILHTYVLYPFFTLRAVRRMPMDRQYYQPSAAAFSFTHAGASNETKPGELGRVPTWPRVSVLMAVHNEEKVLSRKWDSLLAQDYPGEYHIYVGSDCSTDRTNAILAKYAEQHTNLRFVPYATRQGKPGIVNQLRELAPAPASDHVYLLTDASVLLREDVVQQLVKPLCVLPDLALADARMIHTGMQASGIGRSEDTYINREVRLKQAEGMLWGYTIGPFGGCYALRSNYFRPVPANYLVDDFYLCLIAYEAGGRGISVAGAHCFETVGQHLHEEFRRKVRISAGNWQNLLRFRGQWAPPTSPLRYAFFSHKVLRWATPFLLLLLLFSLLMIWRLGGNYWAGAAFVLLALALILPTILDTLLQRVFRLHWHPLRSLRYFVAMNTALLMGFFRYLNGIQSNVWQPSKRH